MKSAVFKFELSTSISMKFNQLMYHLHSDDKLGL